MSHATTDALEGRHDTSSDPLYGDQAAKAKDRPASALSFYDPTVTTG